MHVLYLFYQCLLPHLPALPGTVHVCVLVIVMEGIVAVTLGGQILAVLSTNKKQSDIRKSTFVEIKCNKQNLLLASVSAEA